MTMRTVKLFVIYFPVALVMLQVIGNSLYFISPGIYFTSSFYLNLFLGTNFLFAFFLLAFTFMFRFCAVSRWAAVAECVYAVMYLIIQQDTVYNIAIQIVVGLLALVATFWHYVRKFPGCNFSVGLRFFGDVIRKGSCEKGLQHFDMKKSTVRNHHEKRHA